MAVAAIMLDKHVIMFMLIVFSLVAVSDGRDVCNPPCKMGSVCCYINFCAVTSCQGRYCRTTSDCSWGETCCSHKCARGSGCVGRGCTKDNQCDVGESCCKDVCIDDLKCNCKHDYDCPIGEICCDDGYCSKNHGNCSTSTGPAMSTKELTLIIVGTVLGTLLLIGLILGFICFMYRRSRKVPRKGSGQSIFTIPNNTAPASQNVYGTIQTRHTV